MPQKTLIHKQKDIHHPVIKHDRTFGQRAADKLTEFAGSWTFIIIFTTFLIIWIIINSVWLVFGASWDPYPFIVLNLILSTIAAFQAPVILMSQNRQAERDRIMAKYDYQVNRKAEREVADIQHDLEEIKFMVRNSKLTPTHKEFKDYSQFKAYKKEFEKLKSPNTLPAHKKILFEAFKKAENPTNIKKPIKKISQKKTKGFVIKI